VRVIDIVPTKKQTPPQTSAHPSTKQLTEAARHLKLKHHGPGWLGLGLGLTGVALLSATAGALLAVSLSSTSLLQARLRPEDQGTFNAEGITGGNMSLPQLTRPVNLLIIGTKVLQTEAGGELEASGHDPVVNSLDGLSDSMLLVRFEPETKDLKVLSIPRDTRTEIEGYGETKINEANRLGGPGLTARTVSNLLDGVGIDRYIRVNVLAVEKLVDVLGGVQLYVPRDMKYTDATQHLYIDLKQGDQRLNGEQALQFLRFRYDDLGDIGRIQRQQILMRALIEQAISPMTLVRLPKILSVVQDYIDTNLSIEELVALLNFASGMTREEAQMLMLPGNFNSPESPFAPSYWLPDDTRISAMVAEHFGRSDQNQEAWMADPAYMRVAVQDTTGQAAAVTKFLKTLTDSGYQNTYEDIPWTEPLQTTRIIAQNGDVKSAQNLRRLLGFGEVRIESTGVLESDITVQLGRDWLSRQTKVNATDPGSI